MINEINEINEILENGKKEGKGLRLDSEGYKSLVKKVNPIADKFVEMLAEQGHIKSDPIKIVGNKFWGLRANISCENKTESDIEEDIKKSNYMIRNAEIKPQLVVLNEGNIDLFYRPNRIINLKSDEDYINLIHSFIDYIHRHSDYNIKFLGWNLENDKMISNISHKKSDINFSRELFDSQLTEVYYPSEALIEF